MNKVTLGLLSILTVFSIHAFADDVATDKKEESFDKHKQHTLEKADKEITLVTQFKSCVAAAQDKKALGDCRKNKMDAMKAFHEQNKDDMDDMKKMHEEKAKNK